MFRNKVKIQDPLPRTTNRWGDDRVISYWRPIAAYVYLAICIFDFVIGPVMFTFFAGFTSTGLIMWEPLTVQGGGLFHLSFLAILGVASWTRGQEKIERTRSGPSDTRDRERNHYEFSEYDHSPPENFGGN
jgi:hypothetical protein